MSVARHIPVDEEALRGQRMASRLVLRWQLIGGSTMRATSDVSATRRLGIVVLQARMGNALEGT
ncbi:MAG: hypothetical protein BGO66_05185 [Alicycliphilus sp. 69-12]|nr:MAG: hypothetical protein BGO66_05185 [Alicycliphilus sp. 69-12]